MTENFVFRTTQMNVPDCVKNRPAGISIDRAMIAFLQAGKPDVTVAGMSIDPKTGFVEVTTLQPQYQIAPK